MARKIKTSTPTAPTISYDRWTQDLRIAAGKVGATIAYGTTTHDAYRAGVSVEDYAARMVALGPEGARRMR